MKPAKSKGKLFGARAERVQRRAHERVLARGPRLDQQERKQVETWCRRVRHLLDLRDAVLFEKDVFDRELLVCIKNLQGFSDLDALIDSEDDRWLALCVAWFTGVFRRAKENRHAFEAGVDNIISATVDVLGGPFAIRPDHAQAICGDPEVADLIYGKGGPQAAALLATRYLARAVLPIRHKASERWLWLVLRRVRAQDRLVAILAVIEERGYWAGRSHLE